MEMILENPHWFMVTTFTFSRKIAVIKSELYTFFCSYHRRWYDKSKPNGLNSTDKSRIHSL